MGGGGCGGGGAAGRSDRRARAAEGRGAMAEVRVPAGRAQQGDFVNGGGGSRIHERRWKQQQKILAGHKRAASMHRRKRMEEATARARRAETSVRQIAESGGTGSKGSGGGMGPKERRRQESRRRAEQEYGGADVRGGNRVLELIGQLQLAEAEEFFEPVADKDTGMVDERGLCDALSGAGKLSADGGDGAVGEADVSALFDAFCGDDAPESERLIDFHDFLPDLGE